MWLLLFMIFAMPYEQNPYLSISPSLLGIFPDFTFIKLLGLVGFAWAAVRFLGGDPAIGDLRSRQAKLFLLFYMGVILAGIWSGTGFIAVSRYLAQTLFMFFVLVAVRTQDDLRRALVALVLAPVVAFPYGVRQMMRFGDRMGTGLYEPNYLAANLLLAIPLSFVFASQATTIGRRRLWFGAGAVLITMLVLTASRGGFLGLLVVGMVFAYRRKGLGGALAAVLVLTLLALPTELGTRALATLSGDEVPYGLEASNQAHVALFWAGLRMIADNPIFGVGPFQFKAVSSAYSGLQQHFIAHNSYLELAAEMGLPVLTIFIVLVGTTLRQLRRASRLDVDQDARRLAGWADGMRSGIIGFLVAGSFISAEYEKYFWLVVFLSIAVHRLARGHAVTEAREDLVDTAPEPVPVP